MNKKVANIKIKPANNNKVQMNKQDFKKVLFRSFLYATAAVLLLKACTEPKDVKKTDVPVSKLDKIVAPADRAPIEMKNQKVALEINLNGGVIDSAILNDYKANDDLNAAANTKSEVKNVQLLSPRFAEAPNPQLIDLAKNKVAAISTENKTFSYVNFTLKGDNLVLPTENSEWKAVGQFDDSIKTLVWESPEFTITKTFKFKDDYLVDVSQTIKNKTTHDINIAPYYYMIQKVDSTDWNARKFYGFSSFADTDYKKEPFNSVKNKSYSQDLKENNLWAAFSSNYFGTAIIGDNHDNIKAKNVSVEMVDGDKDSKINAYKMSVSFAPVVVKAGDSFSATDTMFVGPKDIKTLRNYTKKYSINNLTLMINFGFFSFITKVLFDLFALLISWTGLAWLSIILFAILIKLVLHPLTRKSQKSMNDMKKIAPEVKKIQAYYATDKRRQQMEIGALYKKHKINPISGCLPLVLQIPIFFALYSMLQNFIGLRHETFFWIGDLASREHTSIFNLFGLLPFTPPYWLPMIGVLALVMGCTMWLQMKLQGQMAVMTKQQEMMMSIMPVLMVFMFAPMPAALILYYIAYNLITIAESLFLNRDKIKENKQIKKAK